MNKEKRFRKVQGYIYDNQGVGDKLLDFTGMETMLNDLHEEKELLKQLLRVHILFCKSKGYELKDIIKFMEELKK